MSNFKIEEYRYEGKNTFNIKKAETRFKDIYDNDQEYEIMQAAAAHELDDLQSMMYAHNRYGLLLVFQAMDAAGKDGTIKHVISGVNPAGVAIHNFKRPSENELEHDFLWRSNMVLPQRGTIGIFNRSYYEEVLVVKIEKSILDNVQRLPPELLEDREKLFKRRYKDIRNMEKYLHHNGFRVVKFFLNVSKKEQGERLIERIKDPSKNWKFEEQDIQVRDRWDEYMEAYETCINETATEKAPWYVVPADDKKNMRLTVAKIICEELHQLKMQYPAVSKERAEELQRFIKVIEDQNKA
ncbi:PPK2 family polyphosphate kinase [Dyadobacter tibetensis]|uniref:PPK2 family polyphosphate kinase n=1 Tax=Dyadobacter tibetensis TaxID=1211851 RepID=UPI000470411B|nr:phosphate--nucleotide phosphotransferase [Dyadobacter tibetensis]